MPSSATITAFYTFAPSGLLRSSEHNTNFSTFRGHLLPVHPDTATAATSGAYDLGSSDHRWGTLYVTTVNATNAVGGGGGSAVLWSEQAEAPELVVENNLEVYLFQAGLSQNLYTALRVPSSYSAGAPVKILIEIYSPDTSGDILIRAQSTLRRAETDDVASTTNQRTTTNSAITMSSANDNEFQKVELDLSDSSGNINSVAVTAGDMILVRLYRDTDTATSDVRLVVQSGEPKFST